MGTRTIRLCAGLTTFVLGVWALLLGVWAPAAQASSTGSGPFGPPHVLHQGRVGLTLAQATSDRGVSVVVFTATPKSGSRAMVAVQLPGEPWGEAAPVADGPVLRPTVLAWGDGNISLIWQSPAGQDTYRFHLQTIGPDGHWQPAEKLVKAVYAYPVYQAAINDDGQIALAWSNGDLHDRVVVRDANGTWKRLPTVPVAHPTYGGLQFISNPRDLFLDDSGRVGLLTWGNLDGSKRVVWLMHLTVNGDWAAERVAPIQGGRLDYGLVSQVRATSDGQGDIALVLSQKDPSTKAWSTMLRYRPSGGTLGAPHLLTHLTCYRDSISCGDLAMAADGSTVVSYAIPVAGKDNVAVQVVRRSSTGDFSDPQDVSGPMWLNSYLSRSIEVVGNADGYAVVSFDGGDRQHISTEFVRCPAESRCEQAVLLNDAPSWLDPWLTTVGPIGGATVTWVDYYRAGVTTRHLRAAG